MAEVDLNKHIEKGLNFRNLFIDLMVTSVGVFIAFYWKDLLGETITTFMPHGSNIIQKFLIGITITVSLVVIVYFITVVNRRLQYENTKNA